MKKWAVLMLAAALAASGAWYYLHPKKKSQVEGLQTAKVTEGTIVQTIQATGAVSPLNRVEIKPPISGRIERILVDEGVRVKAGQILAWMSSSDRAAILDAARSQGPEAIKHWEDAYKPTPIVAPLSGVVILKNGVVGQTVDPSAVLFAMSDHLIVLGQVDESDIGRIRVGMPAEITLDAFPDQKDTGKVSDILYEGKNVSNVINYGVKIQLQKVPPYFRSEMTANISYIVKKKEKALLLPLTVVTDMPNGVKQVSVPGPNGTLAVRAVKTGIENNSEVEIVSGLALDDSVLITAGKYSPQHGAQSSPLTSKGR